MDVLYSARVRMEAGRAFRTRVNPLMSQPSQKASASPAFITLSSWWKHKTSLMHCCQSCPYKCFTGTAVFRVARSTSGGVNGPRTMDSSAKWRHQNPGNKFFNLGGSNRSYMGEVGKSLQSKTPNRVKQNVHTRLRERLQETQGWDGNQELLEQR